jgi:tetratricopeptide (TPR) repeat protein
VGPPPRSSSSSAAGSSPSPGGPLHRRRDGGSGSPGRSPSPASDPSRSSERDADDWRRRLVEETEAALERVRRRGLAQEEAGRPPPESGAALAAAHCVQLGNSHFRSGGGGSSCSLSYGLAERCYRTALELCREGSDDGGGNSNNDRVGGGGGQREARRGTLALLEADARSNLGAALWATGRADEAVGELRRALGLYESVLGEEPKQQQSPRQRGGDAERVGPAPAPSSSRSAANESPVESRLASVWHQLGLAHCLRGRHRDSVECLERALRLRQDLLSRAGASSSSPCSGRRRRLLEVASTHESLAWVLHRQGRPSGAVRHYRRAAEILIPDHPRRAEAALGAMESLLRSSEAACAAASNAATAAAGADAGLSPEQRTEHWTWLKDSRRRLRLLPSPASDGRRGWLTRATRSGARKASRLPGSELLRGTSFCRRMGALEEDVPPGKHCAKFSSHW